MKIIAAVVLCGTGALLLAQQGASPSQDKTHTIQANANEVVVDVVVRDKKGRPIHGLSASDFHLEEDGNAQKIASVREVSRGNLGGSQDSGGKSEARIQQRTPGGSLDATKQIRLVSLVFDRLGVDGRRLSKQAALDLLKSEGGENTFYAVFRIDQNLKVLQTFTDDIATVRRAVDKATSGTSSDFASDNSGLHRMQALLGDSDDPAASSSSGARSGPQINGGAEASAAMARMIEEMIVTADNAVREQQGRSSLFSLLAIVKEQFRWPGRKTVLFFAEGLQVPSSMYEQFHSIISAANRSNVSIYSIDARGLQVTGDSGAASSALAGAAKSIRRQWSGRSDANPVTIDQVLSLDRAADSIRANVQEAMDELAIGTGGFLMANTNDLRPSLKHIIEDFNDYYELSYTPPDENYDGHFRKISVKVDNPDAKIQARSGYYALPPVEGATIYPHEVPMLNALTQRPLPHAFDYRASFYKFKATERDLQTVLAFDVPLSDVTFERDEKNGLYHTHVSFLVLLKDANGKVLKKYSRDIPFDGSLDKLDAFRQGHFIYTRPFVLPLGRLTLETVVLDQKGMRLSASRSAYFARGSTAPVKLSNLLLIRRTEPTGATPDPEDPLQFKGGTISPSLADSLKAQKGAILPLYFVVYPEEKASAKPALTMEILKDGKRLLRADPELPSADASGSIPYIAEMPIESFTPGDYEVRVTVRQASDAAQEEMFFRIE